MNRRGLFRGVLLLVGASAVDPKALLALLPEAPMAFGPVQTTDVAVTVWPSWPTYEDILAKLVGQWRALHPDARLSADTTDFQMLSVFAGAVFDAQETVRAAWVSSRPVAYRG